jgi:hypothetical protein
MMHDPNAPQLVDMNSTIIQSKGLAVAEVIEGDLHMTFYSVKRDGVGQGAPLIRAVDLVLILPATEAIRALQLMAEALRLEYGPGAIPSVVSRSAHLN